jgi:hypothetical protein
MSYVTLGLGLVLGSALYDKRWVSAAIIVVVIAVIILSEIPP